MKVALNESEFLSARAWCLPDFLPDKRGPTEGLVCILL